MFVGASEIEKKIVGKSEKIGRDLSKSGRDLTILILIAKYL